MLGGEIVFYLLETVTITSYSRKAERIVSVLSVISIVVVAPWTKPAWSDGGAALSRTGKPYPPWDSPKKEDMGERSLAKTVEKKLIWEETVFEGLETVQPNPLDKYRYTKYKTPLKKNYQKQEWALVGNRWLALTEEEVPMV